MDTTLTHFESKKIVIQDRDLRIHEAALKAAGNFKRSEIELIERLEAVDQYKIHYKHGCNSLFSYAVKVLGLSEQVAGIFINVCRKTREVPPPRDANLKTAYRISQSKTKFRSPQSSGSSQKNRKCRRSFLLSGTSSTLIKTFYRQKFLNRRDSTNSDLFFATKV